MLIYNDPKSNDHLQRNFIPVQVSANNNINIFNNDLTDESDSGVETMSFNEKQQRLQNRLNIRRNYEEKVGSEKICLKNINLFWNKHRSLRVILKKFLSLFFIIFLDRRYFMVYMFCYDSYFFKYSKCFVI